MLTNLIGIVVAFVTALLLLSLVAMALVQLTQSLLRLRGRNLLVGIAALVASEKQLVRNLAAPKSARRLSPKPHTDHAAEILNATTAATLRPVDDPNSVLNVVRGPATSWAAPEDVAQAIIARHKASAPKSAVAAPIPHVSGLTSPDTGVGALKDASTPDATELAEKFRALEPAMSDRFARTMQTWTAIWGLAVAIVFQVSTPGLLRMLSTSQAKRDAVLAMVPGVLRQAETAVPAGMSNDFVDRALAQLAADSVVRSQPNATDITARFEQVSGSTDSRQAMVDDLRGVLRGVTNRDSIVQRYGEIIDTTSTHDVNAAITTATASIDSLTAFDITPWGQGPEFYRSLANILGVLLTAMLLSFGAPFWFEQLKNVASLRDALSTKPGEAKV